jgi:DNA-binding IclR family transcriptional regulator
MPRNQLVQSLERGLVILGQIARSDDGLTLQDISRSVGLKPTTAHNLIRTLASQGFVEKTLRPVRYRVGPMLDDLSSLHRRKMVMRRVPAVLRGLFNSLDRATVVFAQVAGGDIRKSMRINAERPSVIEYPQDVFQHPYVSASALLIQSLWTEEERVVYRNRYPFLEYGAHAWGTMDRFDEQMEAVRAKGYAVVDLEKRGVFAVSAPVTGSDGQVLGAIGGNIPFERATGPERRRMIEEVLKAAAELSNVVAGNATKAQSLHTGERK